MKRRPKVSVGIDLGTTRSAIALVTPEGRAEIIPNREGERLTPSVVFFEKGAIVVGRAAEAEALIRPEDVIQSVKRHMGDAGWLREFGGVFYRPHDISALILRKLKEDAENFLGAEVAEAVITVPAYFHDLQRSATLEAASLAGISPLRLLNEPTAAALAYRMQIPQADGLYMIFDLGGGTCDVSIVEVTGERLDVKATKGHAFLGGQDWDALVIHRVAADFLKHFGVDPLDDPRAWQDLQERAIHARHLLSSREDAVIALSYAGFFLRHPLTRQDLEAMSQGLLHQASDLCRLILEDTGLGWSELQAVYLVGGATRMPMIEALLKKAAGSAPKRLLNPDEAVVLGAAWQAASLRQKSSVSFGGTGALPLGEGASEEAALSASWAGPKRLGGRVAAYDVTSHTLGLIVLDRRGLPFVDPILPRYSPLPAEHQEVYYTAYDQQVSIEIRIVEGESRDPKECIPIGLCELQGLPPRPSGQEIHVTFLYDPDGVLSISVVDVGSGQRRRLEIQRGIQRPPKELEAMRRFLRQTPLK